MTTPPLPSQLQPLPTRQEMYAWELKYIALQNAFNNRQHAEGLIGLHPVNAIHHTVRRAYWCAGFGPQEALEELTRKNN